MRHQHSQQLDRAGIARWIDSPFGQAELTALVLDGQELDRLPPELDQFGKLETLSLYDNRLTALPPAVTALEGLRTLNLAANQLTTLSEHIGRLKRLKMLDIGHNRLVELPASLGRLAALRFPLSQQQPACGTAGRNGPARRA